MKISIIGAGYVGLVSAICFAKMDNEVTLIDIDNNKIRSIGKGISPIHEEGLDELLGQVPLKVSTDYLDTISSEVIFICVGTPSDDRGIILEPIKKALERLAGILKTRQDYCVVVVKSTVAPGTTDETVIPILEKSGKKAGKDFGVCMSPEFLSEGKAINDFMYPMRVIIGEYDKRSCFPPSSPGEGAVQYRKPVSHQ